MVSKAIAKHFKAQAFAVVGASSDEAKFGNKVLRWYIAANKYVIPINPREKLIEHIPCMKSLGELLDPQHTSISVITPPKVTSDILRQAKELNIHSVWLQPGSEPDEVYDPQYRAQLPFNLIFDGPCVLVHASNYAKL
ncbi:NAD(P)-binding protein [Basidiobolus meristosporus CBS 931.73]|uniref:NAD(P)-binding protein n=1 Tax=Basidiobolus meristosporus CBS 931.73 TaxID=1314790 RepID=A0A1Y1YNV9_9FUNG|nr:NAD(P)-binding protein [Basidiobolus meristosporus CBS 931.73]|eukprot:ORX99655.1 NAD(P)-binding protein [Basidiobolus meristosporus CBS 931.73]